MSLQVLEPGLCSLLVDAGRPGTRSLGVPVGGPADRWSMSLGNALVKNLPDTPALEIAGTGPTLLAECDLAAVVFGAPFELSSGRQHLQANKSFVLRSGEVLRIGGTPRQLRAYLCVRGGFQAERILGSVSALQPLMKGDRLSCSTSTLPVRSLLDMATSTVTKHAGVTVLPVLAGPQADWFDLRAFAGESLYRVTPASNRMGLRLAGPALLLPPGRELVSEPVCPGTVQVTRDGQCILLGVDGQTIGGYAKIAQVCSASLATLGQLRPGESVRFQLVDMATATALYRAKEAELQAWVRRLLL